MAETTIPSEPDTPLLYLRAIRGILARLARVEREVVDLRRDILGLHEDWVGMTRRLDNLDGRMARIERRLDLVETTSQ
jgi:hypothetical protein